MEHAAAFLSCADKLCEQFRPRPGLTERPTLYGSKPFDTLIVFLKYFLKKVVSRRQLTQYAER